MLPSQFQCSHPPKPPSFPPKQNNCCSRGDGYHGPSYLRLDTAGQEPHLIRPAALLRCEKASQAALIPPVARPAGSAW